MSKQERILIIGNGMAGGKLAEELVARGRDRFDLTDSRRTPCVTPNPKPMRPSMR